MSEGAEQTQTPAVVEVSPPVAEPVTTKEAETTPAATETAVSNEAAQVTTEAPVAQAEEPVTQKSEENNNTIQATAAEIAPVTTTEEVKADKIEASVAVTTEKEQEKLDIPAEKAATGAEATSREITETAPTAVESEQKLIRPATNSRPGTSSKGAQIDAPTDVLTESVHEQQGSQTDPNPAEIKPTTALNTDAPQLIVQFLILPENHIPPPLF